MVMIGSACAAAAGAQARLEHSSPIETPDGAVVRNFGIDPRLNPSDLHGVLVAGTAASAPVLYEFFDYGCPFCRLAWQELDLLLGPDAGLRVGLVHHPVLGAPSAAAARVVLAAQRVYGDVVALGLHGRMFDSPGRVGAEKALELARASALDTNRLKATAASPHIHATLSAHVRRAELLGLRSTPAFVIGRYAFLGWPGPQTVQTFVESLQHCGGLACRG